MVIENGARISGVNFTIGKRLGRGGQGDVYLAYPDSSPILAAKFSRTNPEKLRNEAEIQAQLQSPHVVRSLLYLPQTPYGPCLLLEYAPYGSIQNYMQRDYSDFAALAILRGLTQGLIAAHRIGIAHGDVKPENGLLFDHPHAQGYWETRLGDLGSARYVGKGNQLVQTPYAFFGSPHYAAPELFDGRVGFASDQYSTGIVAQELLAGERPYSGTQEELERQHRFMPLPALSTGRRRLSDLAYAVEPVIQKMTEKEPSERWGSMEEVDSMFSELQITAQEWAALGRRYYFPTEPAPVAHLTSNINSPVSPNATTYPIRSRSVDIYESITKTMEQQSPLKELPHGPQRERLYPGPYTTIVQSGEELFLTLTEQDLPQVKIVKGRDAYIVYTREHENSLFPGETVMIGRPMHERNRGNHRGRRIEIGGNARISSEHVLLTNNGLNLLLQDYSTNGTFSQFNFLDN